MLLPSWIKTSCLNARNILAQNDTAWSQVKYLTFKAVPVSCILTKKVVWGLQGHKVKNIKVALFLEGQDASNGVSKVPVGPILTKKPVCGLQDHKVKNI